MSSIGWMFYQYFRIHKVTICVKAIPHRWSHGIRWAHSFQWNVPSRRRQLQMISRKMVSPAAAKWMEKSAKSRGHRVLPYVVVSRLQTLVHCSFSVHVSDWPPENIQSAHSWYFVLNCTHTHSGPRCSPWQLGVSFQFYLYFWCWKLLTTYLGT